MRICSASFFFLCLALHKFLFYKYNQPFQEQQEKMNREANLGPKKKKKECTLFTLFVWATNNGTKNNQTHYIITIRQVLLLLIVLFPYGTMIKENIPTYHPTYHLN